MSDTPVAECPSPPEILVRRNLSMERRAMAMAFIYPEADRRKRGKRSQKTGTLWKARYILRHSPALAEDVLADRKKLDEALQIVEKARQHSNSIDDDDAGHSPLTTSLDGDTARPQPCAAPHRTRSAL